MTSIRRLTRILPFAVLLALVAPLAHAAVECNGACHDLVEKARALEGQGKYQEALNTYKAAEQADRQASQPVSMAAALLLRLSAGMRPEQAKPVRDMAQAGASYALKLAPDDPLALETLRLIDDAPAPLHAPTPDLALRLALGASEAKLRGDATAGGTPRSPYSIELDAWRMALKAIDETQAKGGQALTEPALLQMQAFARDGQLEPALLLLSFRQAWRPELEAWEAAHPGGVKTFIDRYGLRP